VNAYGASAKGEHLKVSFEHTDAWRVRGWRDAQDSDGDRCRAVARDRKLFGWWGDQHGFATGGEAGNRGGPANVTGVERAMGGRIRWG